MYHGPSSLIVVAEEPDAVRWIPLFQLDGEAVCEILVQLEPYQVDLKRTEFSHEPQ
jgi:hypothetical protein